MESYSGSLHRAPKHTVIDTSIGTFCRFDFNPETTITGKGGPSIRQSDVDHICSGLWRAGEGDGFGMPFTQNLPPLLPPPNLPWMQPVLLCFPPSKSNPAWLQVFVLFSQTQKCRTSNIICRDPKKVGASSFWVILLSPTRSLAFLQLKKLLLWVCNCAEATVHSTAGPLDKQK